MDKLREFLEKKKEKSSSRRPRYGTRKLSVGLVSCVLGYCIFLSPSVVNAQVGEGASEPTSSTSTEASAVTSASGTESGSAETKAVDNGSADKVEKSESTVQTDAKEEITKKTEAPATETPVVEAEKESPAVVEDEAEEPAVSEEKSEPVAEEDAETKEVSKKEEIEAPKANKEANIEETVAADEKEVVDEEEQQADVAEAKKEEPAEVDEENKEEATEGLGISEEPDKEALQASEATEAGRDISNDITEAEIHVGETKQSGTLRADLGENLKWEVKFKAPDDTKAGDYFDIKLSDNWTLKGIEPDTESADPIKIGEKTIAVGKRIDRHHIRYTFTEDIDDLDDIKVNVQYGGYDDKEKIKYSSDQKFEIGVGDKKDEKDLYVNYGRPFYDQFGTTINGRSQYTSWNPETGEFTQVFYINPDSKFISSSNEDFLNNNVGVYINNRDYDDKETQVKFTAENTTVDIVKLPSRTRIPDAVYENPVEGETDNSVTTTFDTNGITVNLNKNSINNPYIITLKSRINPNVEKINLGSGASVYGNGTNHYLGMANVIQYETGKTGGSGVEETHALGDRVWIDDNKDGLQTEGEKGVEGVTVKLTGGDLTEAKTTKTDANGNYKFEGLKNGEYTVTFETPEGYEITKTNIGEDDEKDSDGLEVKATIKDADNMSVDLGLVKKEAPVDPSEPSKPEEPKDTTPLVPLTPAEEVEFERTTHHNHKTPGTPVVTEVPSTPVVETEKPVEEKTEETTKVENKEENVEEVKESEEVKAVESEDEVVEEVEANEVDKNLAPVSTNDDTKAPKTGDAGILSSAGLASLAASGLAYLEIKKRNKKNK